MSSLDRIRWDELNHASGIPGDSDQWYDQLVQLYSEPQRHYHNVEHIVDCLNEFAHARHLARDPNAVELAIWFHDAIYDPRASDKEEKSAQLATRFFTELGASNKLQLSVEQLVLATKAHDASLHPDAPLLVDIDLSILGQTPDRFWKYEDQIRKEYEWVPQEIFSTKRAEILERFLAREKIFHTEPFFTKYEKQARQNLAASVERLRA